ncbi:selenocysteine insertion sequence-binding protein 2 [Rhinophrynus dorsalis]
MSSERANKPIAWSTQSHKNVKFSSTTTPLPPPTYGKEQSLQTPRKMALTANINTEVELDEVVVKKKRKKKKNKANPNSDSKDGGNTHNENIIVQEPPKFQDDDEFPDLASSVRGLRTETQRNHCYSQAPKQGMAASTKGSGKKSKAPVQLDLGGMLAALELKQHTEKTKQLAKPVVLSVGSGVPVLSREPVTATKQSKQGTAPHNPLDSSAPLVKKGKQREVPKAKKPTSLKKIILKEREQRKQRQCSVTQEAITSPSEDVLPDEVELPANEQDDSLPVPHEQSEQESPVDHRDADDEPSDTQPAVSDVLCPLPQSTSNLPKIHSRRFREYCSQVLSKEVDSCVTDLLKELVRFQDRLYLKDPVKAKTKRRLVMGLREVLKHLKLRKLKCIIISPNCEKIQSKGGLDDTLQTIICCACEQNVPFVFALNRKALGRCLNKAVPVSVVGIFSYDGAQDHFHKLYELTMQARQDYKDMITALQEQQSGVGGNEPEPVSEISTKPDVVNTKAAAEDTDEPNYIKVWKRMLEEEYNPYALSLEGKVTTDMLNLQL